MRALILVDIQNDFLPGGALPVPAGDAILPIVNQLIPTFDLVVATQDWHPEGHQSFASNHPQGQVGQIIDLHGLEQILWPDHCIQGSDGASFASELTAHSIAAVFQKGTDIKIDSYSGFFDNGHRKDTGLSQFLKSAGVEQVYIVGLALDYCVKYTALDARSLGFKTHVIQDATRAVNLQQYDDEKALTELRQGGVILQFSQDLLTKSEP